MALPYSALDPQRSEIRLLRIEPEPSGKHGDGPQTTLEKKSPLRYTVEIVPLDDRPIFHALSYVWGDPTQTTPMVVDGISVPVTLNLEHALSQHRRMKYGHRIWVDAVCINQTDIVEKSSQIQLMSRIYEQATTVFCWLGQTNEYISYYLSWKSTLQEGNWGIHDSRRLAGIKTSARWLKVRFKSWPFGASRDEKLLRAVRIICGQAEFLSLPYFQRMWTYQESMLPGDRILAVVGDREVPKHTPRKFHPITEPQWMEAGLARLSSSKLEQLTPTQAKIVKIITSHSYTALVAVMQKALVQNFFLDDMQLQRALLCELLLVTEQRRCQDPRDKIFSLLSLLGERTAKAPGDTRWLSTMRRELLAVDYSKPTELVIRDALFYVHTCEMKRRLGIILTGYHTRAGILSRMSSDGERDTSPTLLAIRKTLHENVTVGNNQRNEYVHPSWLPDMSRPNAAREINAVYSGRGIRHERLEIDWLQRRETPTGYLGDRLQFFAKPVGRVMHIMQFPGSVKQLAIFLVTLEHEILAVDPERTVPDLGSLYAEVATELGVEDVMSTQDSDPLQQQCRSFVRRITRTTNLSSSFATALRSRAHITGITDMHFWIVVWYLSRIDKCLEKEQEDILRHANQIATGLSGLALFVLDLGHFGFCSGIAKIGDEVVSSASFLATMLLRPICRDGCSGASLCGRHEIPGSETYVPSDTPPSHLLVCYSFVDGLERGRNFDEEFAGRIRDRPDQSVVLG